MLCFLVILPLMSFCCRSTWSWISQKHLKLYIADTSVITGALTVSWKPLSVFNDYQNKANLVVLGQLIFQTQKTTSQAVLKQIALSATSPIPRIGTSGHSLHAKMGSTWVQLRHIFLSHSHIKRFSFQAETALFWHKRFLFYRTSLLGSCCRYGTAKQQSLHGFAQSWADYKKGTGIWCELMTL